MNHHKCCILSEITTGKPSKDESQRKKPPPIVPDWKLVRGARSHHCTGHVIVLVLRWLSSENDSEKLC